MRWTGKLQTGQGLLYLPIFEVESEID